MEQLANLPPLALVVFGTVLAVIFAVQRFGFLSGVNGHPGKNASSATIAAVVVDSTELRRASIALESHTLATNRLVSAIEGAAKSVDELAQEADRVREELHITRELARRGG